MNELDIFSAALALRSPEEQRRYLDEACGKDVELRRRIEDLLGAHAQAGSFMGAPAPDRASQATIDEPVRETTGAQIGPYKLLEQIGEGGMGDVWLAEQSEPIQRRVAIKVIKAGMDSKQVLARFDAERQALALMEHLNIARVLDAGATTTGRPYFVMELVKGTPITKFCDEKKLNVRERLELFGDVCRAVQHAHQKGIIHRDIKPSNVLVAPYDGKPVVKVIDFGVAKATGQKLTDATLFTGFGAVVGTPEYMSPEQAEVNNQDIDTRSDIYSLGVFLYELLTGSTPLTKKRVKDAAFLEILRVIREEEPPKPSTRLSSTEELPSISVQRQSEPAKLTKLVRGELDWIVMKALEKDRSRRYETANGFAMDVQRYQADEPVQACPPSATYRIRKFARRNKVILLTVMLIGVAILWGTGISMWQAVRATRAETESSRQRDRARANFRKARQAVEEYFTKVSQNTLLRSPLPGLQPLRKDLLESALKYFQEFVVEANDDPTVAADLAAAHLHVGLIAGEIGNKDDALAALLKARTFYEQLLAADPTNQVLQKEVVRCILAQPAFSSISSVDTTCFSGSLEEAIARGELLWQADRENDELQRELAECYRELGDALGSQRLRSGDQKTAEDAVRALERCMELNDGLLRRNSADANLRLNVAETLHTLSHRYRQMPRWDKAQEFESRAQVIAESLTSLLPNDIRLQILLANIYFGMFAVVDLGGGVDKQSRPWIDKAIALRERIARENPAVGQFQSLLAQAYQGAASWHQSRGERVEAMRYYEQARPLMEKLIRENANDVAYGRQFAIICMNIGHLNLTVEKLDVALASYRQGQVVHEALLEASPANNRIRAELAVFYTSIGNVHTVRKTPDEAIRWYQKAHAMYEQASKSDPVYYRGWLAWSWQELGRLERSRGNSLEAARCFRETVGLLESLTTQDAKAIFSEEHGKLATALEYLGETQKVMGQPTDALRSQKQADAIREILAKQNPGDRAYLLKLAKSKMAMAAIQRELKKVGDEQQSLREAVAIFAQLPPEKLALVDQAACASMLSSHVADGKERARWSDQAMDNLRHAIAVGFSDIADLKTSPDFEALRSRQDYQKLVAELEAKSKKSGK